MPHNRAPKQGSKFYLPRAQYRYVVAFCLTYNDLRLKLIDLDGRHSHENDGMPHGSGTSDPTGREGIRRLETTRKIELIEETVREVAGPYMYAAMLASVTSEITYDQLRARYNLPIGRNQFSVLRRKIYWTIEKAL